jgi:hypothetical protein
VLEGRDRVGGKILTFSDVPGLPEAGGQSIASGYGRLIDAANRSAVVLEDVLQQQLKHPDITLVLDGAPVSKAPGRSRRAIRSRRRCARRCRGCTRPSPFRRRIRCGLSKTG